MIENNYLPNGRQVCAAKIMVEAIGENEFFEWAGLLLLGFTCDAPFIGWYFYCAIPQTFSDFDVLFY